MLALVASLWASSAYAVDCQYRVTPPVLTDQSLVILQCDINGNILYAPRGNLAVNFAVNNAGVQIKTGAGVFTGLTINTAGTGSSVTLYDGISVAGTKLGTFTTTAQGSISANIAFTTGLFAVLAGAGAADVTIQYR